MARANIWSHIHSICLHTVQGPWEEVRCLHGTDIPSELYNPLAEGKSTTNLGYWLKKTARPSCTGWRNQRNLALYLKEKPRKPSTLAERTTRSKEQSLVHNYEHQNNDNANMWHIRAEEHSGWLHGVVVNNAWSTWWLIIHAVTDFLLPNTSDQEYITRL